MAKVNITIRMDENLKKQADDLFNDLGMNLTTAFTLFAKQAIREQGIPFEITKAITNTETIKALNEFNAMVSNKSEYKRYDSFEDLVNEVIPK